MSDIEHRAEPATSGEGARGVHARPRHGAPGRTGLPFRLPTSVLLLLAGVAVLGLVMANAPVGVRALPVLAYVAVVPGLAWVRLLRPLDPVLTAALSIGLSLALAILVAQGMLYVDRWSTGLGVGLLVLIATIPCVLDVVGKAQGRVLSHGAGRR